jgi:hypothetical protein
VNSSVLVSTELLSEQTQVKILLAKLESTPMLRKRPPNVWTIEEVPDAPENCKFGTHTR